MNCLLTGIGGQGIVFASKLIAQTSMAAGRTVRTAETIGMAQRGGSVVSHIRVDEDTLTPLIGKGTADVIIAFEPGEAYRVVDYLAPSGALIVCDLGVQSPADALTKKEYDIKKYLDGLRALPATVHIVSGNKLIETLGTSKAINVALVGAACKTGNLNLTFRELEDTIRRIAPQRFIELNLQALKLGFDLAK